MTLGNFSFAELSLPQAQWTALEADAEAEGLGFVRELREDWLSGINRFNLPGERLFGVFMGNELAGICGLLVDTRVHDPDCARLTALYVRPSYRHQGLARAMVWRLIEHARGEGFTTLRVRCQSETGDEVYRSMGFLRSYEGSASHRIGL